MPEPHAFKALLLDIEGTTTPISFVYDTLFPYAREQLEAFLSANSSDEAVQADINAIADQAAADIAAGEDAPPVPKEGDEARLTGALTNLRWQMEHDKKTTGLKSLQGKIWRAGYEDGSLKGEVFDDVVPLLEWAQEAGIETRIYSSGSVPAQKLLFGFSTRGDLTTYLSGYYDTTTGSKKSHESYVIIAKDMGRTPGEILFATDNLQEAEAATQAGMQVVLMRRPGNPDVGEHPFFEADDFTGISALA